MNKKAKILLIVVDIIAILGVFYMYHVWQTKRVDTPNEKIPTTNNDTNNQESNPSSVENNENPVNEVDSKKANTYKFKKFTFEIPQDISYKEVDEYSFKLSSNEFEAIIEIILHDDTNMLKNPDLYYEEITQMGMKVSKPEKIKLGIIDAIKYNVLDKNSNLYYFAYNSGFDYEVELTDKGDNIGRVMNILLTAKYDNDSQEKYNYMKWYYDTGMSTTTENN